MLRHPDGGSIGIEVKCLGTKRHTAKLTQGIGQAMLALANRTHTLLAIHCGTADVDRECDLRVIEDDDRRGSPSRSRRCQS